MRQLRISKSITNRESESIEKYLVEISKVELLSPEEEVNLAEKIKNGDLQALEKLIKANLRFVISVAKQYQNQGLFLNDLINEGNLGLMKAAIRFDETRGFKFISYAVWWIRQSILQALTENSNIVRLPANKTCVKSKLNRAFQQLEQELEREPAAEEMKDMMVKMGKEDINDFIQETNKPISLDQIIIRDSYEDGEGKFLELFQDRNIPPPTEKLMDESLKKEIQRVLTKILSPREIQIINFCFGLEGEKLSFDEIAPIFGLTPERIRQLQVRAIKKLKKTPHKKLLKAYLG